MIARTAALCVALLILPSSSFAAKSPLRIPGTTLEPVAFGDLKGWNDDDQSAAFAAFRKSCEPILLRRRAKVAVKPFERSLRDACDRAASLRDPVDKEAARNFFEQSFRPVRISKVSEKEGFITGYYEPVVEGSLTPGNGYTVPIYRRPDELVMKSPGSQKIRKPARSASVKRTRAGTHKAGRIVPFYDRAAIENGALAGRNLEIVWLKDEIEAFFTHIQGSARVRLPDGKILRINYDAQNGHPYFAVGRTLIERGIVPADEMSMDKIRLFIAEHAEEGRELMRLNKSYIFFRVVEALDHDAEPIGAQGVELTRDRSIAVDRSLHVYGTPFWIEAELPLETVNSSSPFRRLMVAQDTGGAIVGPARADLYLGAGIEAGTAAGRLRHPGMFYMLVPRAADPGPAVAVPLPPRRPVEIPMPPARPKKS
ncbi:MAG: MltA domain-containing protein [Bradyrhizobiaceae bacterium]|nr:MltA domain-containing protein [Bradyrhizobiaceae bacterium]